MAVKKYFKIWILQSKNSIMRRMAFKSNFVILIFATFIQMFLVVVFMKIIFGFFYSVSGWTFDQIMIVSSSYMIVEGLLWAICGYLSGLDDLIRRGKLDQLLVRPIDIQFSTSVSKADPEDWSRVILGIIVLLVFASNLNFSSINLFFYILIIINSFIITYSFILMVRTLLFWLINANSLRYLIENIIRMSQYPTDIFFHKAVRLFFSIAIPLAFVATIPAKILIHGPKLDLILYSCLLAFVFFVGSRKFFLYGLKHYSSASS